MNRERDLFGWWLRLSILAACKAFCFLASRFLQAIWPGTRFFGPRARVLCPGDPPPDGERACDYYDYRGVAVPGELGALTRAYGVSLGSYLWPDGRRGPQLSLPLDLLHRNCAVIGPPGAGKTEGLIIPWILDLVRAGASVITVDVEGDLVDRVGPAVRQMGVRIWYWNSADPRRSQSWNWLAAIRDGRDIEGAVQSILGRPRPNDPQPYFYERDYRWLRALIAIAKAAHGQRARPSDLYRLIADQDYLRDQFRRQPGIQRFGLEVADLLQFPLHEHSRAVSGLLNALHLFNTPAVTAVTERSDFALADLATRPTLLIIGASLADARAGVVLSGIMLNQLIALVYRRFAPFGAARSRPLYFLLDEAPRLRDRVNLGELLSVGRSAGVGVCLAGQDVAQFGDEGERSALFSNCLIFIALRGCSATTAQYLASRLGQRMDRQIGRTRYRGFFDLVPDQIAQAAHATPVPVLREREIMHPPAGGFSGVVHAAAVSPKPFLVDLTRG